MIMVIIWKVEFPSPYGGKSFKRGQAGEQKESMEREFPSPYGGKSFKHKLCKMGNKNMLEGFRPLTGVSLSN